MTLESRPCQLRTTVMHGYAADSLHKQVFAFRRTRFGHIFCNEVVDVAVLLDHDGVHCFGRHSEEIVIRKRKERCTR